ncbi:MAG: TldD/PmbA family protein [Acidimicrobiales bacterium]|nr:TldD/PmbA family protein [Hyphomonadaceae bacterium]RZV42492.1 MAG: TldD/PmbA family protein [Acidimicrobiales bacterium]
MKKAAKNTPDVESLKPTLETLLKLAKKHGADAADAITAHGRSLSIGVREGELEDIDNSEGKEVGLRVFIGQRQATVSSSDLSSISLERLAERAVAMAKLAPEDPYCGLADPARLATDVPELDIYDATELKAADLFERAKILDQVTRGVPGVSMADSASAYAVSSAVYFMTSHGFSKGWRSSQHGLSVMAIAEQDGAMERDYDYAGSRWYEDLPTPESIALSAANRALSRLGSKQLPSSAMPVIYDHRVAKSLVSAFTSAISGPSISRGVSFLKDAMDTQVFNKQITITDDPYRVRGHGSRPWDGEGVAGKKMNLIDSGKLTTWILNTASANQLKLETTGHAHRGIGTPPGVSTSNTYIHAGEKSPEQLMSDIGNGLLVTDMFGPSLNANTGDYSVGCSGFAIENGEPSFPVSEITVAGNLKDMYLGMTPANDLKFDQPTCAPSLLIEEMVVASGS